MGTTSSIIETGVDKLVNLINAKGRVASYDAARELGVSSTVIMEWADFLEEEGIISIEYKFTKPFLVARKLQKKDIQEKAKEFAGKKDVFIRKAEVSLSFLDREANKLRNLKEDFDKIKKDLGLDIDSIKNELAELKKYEELKLTLDTRLEDQRASSMNKLQEITQHISREKRKYQEILTQIGKEEKMLENEKIQTASLEESEKIINDKLNSLAEAIKKVEARAKIEDASIKGSGKNIEKLMQIAEITRVKVEKEKNLVDPLVQKSKEQAENIIELQNKIVNKIMFKEKKLKSVKKVSKDMGAFFKKKFGLLNLIERLNKDRNELQNDLIALIKKAKSFQLSTKSRDVGEQILDLENKFKAVDEKKKNFEKELKELSSFLK